MATLTSIMPGFEAEPDDALVEACVNGTDPAAFATLVGRYQNHVFRLALSVLGAEGEGDAQDVAQEVFIRVARHLPGFRRESTFRTWLHSLTLNMALDRKRARARRPQADPELLDDYPTTDRADDPFLAAEAAELRRSIGQCMQVMPEGLRSIIDLYYWQDLSVEEIATMLRVAPGTVKSQLHRGRKFLYRAMQSKGLHSEEL